MNLFRLPHLVQLEILKQMLPSDQFLLSLCSKRAKNFIKCKFPKSRELNVRFSDDGIEISIKKKSKKVETKNDFMKIVIIPPETRFFAENAVLKIEDIELPCKFFYDASKMFCILFRNKYKHTSKLMKYLCDLFHTSLENVVFNVLNLETEDIFEPNFIKSSILPKKVFGERNRKKMEQFYNYHSDQFLSIIPEKVEYIPKTRNLIFPNPPHSDHLLVLFHGENALFLNASLTKYSVKEFLRHWSRSIRDCLKTIIVFQNEKQELKIDDGLETFDLKKMEITDENRFYKYDSVISKHHVFPSDTFDCIDGLIIRKQTDGKSATIKISEKYFRFFVSK